MVGAEFVFADLAAESVAMDAEGAGGTGLVTVVAIENAPDEALFEFADSFVK